MAARQEPAGSDRPKPRLGVAGGSLGPFDGLLLLLAPAALAFAAYGNTLANGMVYDDPYALRRATQFSLDPLHSFLSGSRSIMYLSIHLDQLLWEGQEAGFHLSNILLHALASALASLSVWRLIRRYRPALFTGLLFAVHPIHVEAVASIENRKDLLAMIFVTTAVILFLGNKRRFLTYPAALACVGLAFLSKEPATVGILGVLPLVWFHTRVKVTSPARFLYLKPALLVLPVLVVLLLGTVRHLEIIGRAFSPTVIQSRTEGRCLDYGDVLVNSAAAVPAVLGSLILPINLSADYQAIPRASPAAPAGLLILSLCVAAVVWLARREPVAALAIAWILIMYLPCSNVIPLTRFFRADRYLYTPSLGFCLLLALGLDAAAGNRPPVKKRPPFAKHRAGRPRMTALFPTGRRGIVAAVVAMLLLGLGGIGCWRRNRDWHDNLSLWSSALRTNPAGSARICYNLGIALFQENRFEEAAVQFRRALRFPLQPALSHHALGEALLKTHDLSGAIEQFRLAVGLAPENPDFHYSLGVALLRAGRFGEAIENLERAVAFRPEEPMYQRSVGRAHGLAGQPLPGLAHLRRARHMDPTSPEVHLYMGDILESLGQYSQAEAEYERALVLGPDLVPVLNGLAWHLATCPLAERRNGTRALQLAERASRMAPQDLCRTLEVSAAAYGATGQYDRALVLARRALRLAEDFGAPSTEGEIASMIRLFEAKRPFIAARSPRDSFAVDSPPPGK